MHALITLLALFFDAALGYPQWLFGAIGHPVSWIGRLIARCDAAWNGKGRGKGRSAAVRRRNGVAMLLLCLGVALAATLGAQGLALWLLPSWAALLLLGLLASSLLAQRSLNDHVAAVAHALETGTLKDAQGAVSQIVGRDPHSLDAHAIGRAAIESLAENFSDGVTAPGFWMVIGGLPGAALYKTINTADSMVGHRSERHAAFGWASARLDDLVNLPASRLSALMLAGAALLVPKASARGAIKAVFRDAKQHKSPNAGWPEAAMAGALGLKIAGPRMYDGVLVPDHWMGDGRASVEAADIRRALTLFRVAALLQAALVAAIALPFVL
ncbi:adenosylcobinamide-phosphate synthase CbiB [Methyloligella sp. 2.7D]|uniref:adenosylcobinamide-phosphate synthase CbiB n=1 Tax=unclassified Methyloligella TaxID=2625955 RepID=UPI00157BC5EA|nr:adenosylcobinamide-phosphate synthase CbiB [Methyloligella sp. GL2]QKP78169.1 cobalamin biosynthesis protein CobD [Methyloligella sp. GL2]